MMKMEGETMMIKQALLRGSIPLIIMISLSTIMHFQGLDPFQVRSTLIVGLIVSVVAATTIIYEIENWSLLKQSITHFVIMLLTVFPCLLISGWFELKSTLDYLKVFGLFVLVGIVLWSLSYFILGRLLSNKS